MKTKTIIQTVKSITQKITGNEVPFRAAKLVSQGLKAGNAQAGTLSTEVNEIENPPPPPLSDGAQHR